MHNEDYRELPDVELTYTGPAPAAQIEDDARTLAFVRELLDVDVFNFHGLNGPRHITQARDPQWDWRHHGYALGENGLALHEFSTSLETVTITMDASEAEKLCSILLEWWLVERTKEMDAATRSSASEHPV